MTAYIIRRLLMAVIILILVTLIIFFVMHLLPGDPLIIYIGQQAGSGSFTEEQIDELYRRFGLDQPLMVQYWNWITGIMQGDMGESIFYHDDVADLLMERFPPTLVLGIESFIFYNILGIVLGMLAALRRGTWIDTCATVFSYLGVSIPVFWLALLLIYGFGLHLEWFPIAEYVLPWEDFLGSLHASVLPVICLSLMGWATIMRQTRSSVLEVVSQDYIRTAWAKGLTERVIVFKHMLKNALIPVITMMGIGLGLMFGGQVFVEQVFGIAGVGRLLVTAVLGQDYQVVQSATLIISTIIIVVNLIVDISYGWLDPRIRYN